MQALSRRDREQLRHRQEILAAAEAVFAEKGFHNATMEDIAQKSEFAIGSLYKHFKSKEAIFVSLFEEKLTGYMQGIEAVASEAKPFLARFDDFLEYYTSFAQHNQAFFQLFHSSAGTMDWHKQDIQECLRPSVERYIQCMTDFMADGAKECILRRLEPSDLAAFVMGTLHSFFIQAVQSNRRFDFRQKLPLLRSLLLEGAGSRG